MTVIVQTLGPAAREDVLAHLLRLPPEDRRMRFESTLSDEAVRDYVASLDFHADRVFGIYTPDMRLVGTAHLALDLKTRSAEFGVSVDPAERGRGYGYALLERARLAAVNLGCRTMFMHCLPDNHVMAHLAAKAGMKVLTLGGETDAKAALELPNVGALAEEAVEEQIAFADLVLKRQFAWIFPRRSA
jgi:RimJ/RimL family protein N-acetyltransferase